MEKVLPPKISNTPFKKIKLPDHLYQKIIEEYKSMSFDNVVCDVKYDTGWGDYSSYGVSIPGSKSPFYNFSQISKELYDECFSTLTPIIEEWSGVKVEKTWGYGIRSYVKYSTLKLHRDRCDTHILSCIIFVDEKSEEKWPLDFFDHDHNHHQITFESGDLLFYESLCLHGRITPFNGDYYRNMYFHWKPKNWDCSNLKNLKCTFVNLDEYLNYYE